MTCQAVDVVSVRGFSERVTRAPTRASWCIPPDHVPLLSAAFEVNFMDDVGQTLLNWASAFGTQEMVKRP